LKLKKFGGSNVEQVVLVVLMKILIKDFILIKKNLKQLLNVGIMETVILLLRNTLSMVDIIYVKARQKSYQMDA
jgi:indole-3-glycerol phosphate synthase